MVAVKIADNAKINSDRKPTLKRKGSNLPLAKGPIINMAKTTCENRLQRSINAFLASLPNFIISLAPFQEVVQQFSCRQLWVFRLR